MEMMVAGGMFAVVGLFSFVCALARASFFMDSRKARGMSMVFGREGARLIYMGLGGLFMLIGAGMLLFGGVSLLVFNVDHSSDKFRRRMGFRPEPPDWVKQMSGENARQTKIPGARSGVAAMPNQIDSTQPNVSLPPAAPPKPSESPLVGEPLFLHGGYKLHPPKLLSGPNVHISGTADDWAIAYQWDDGRTYIVVTISGGPQFAGGQGIRLTERDFFPSRVSAAFQKIDGSSTSELDLGGRREDQIGSLTGVALNLFGSHGRFGGITGCTGMILAEDRGRLIEVAWASTRPKLSEEVQSVVASIATFDHHPAVAQLTMPPPDLASATPTRPAESLKPAATNTAPLPPAQPEKIAAADSPTPASPPAGNPLPPPAGLGALGAIDPATEELVSLNLTDDGKWAIAGTKDGGLIVFDPASRSVRAGMQVNDGRPLETVAIAPDGRLAVVAAPPSGDVLLIDIDERRPVAKLDTWMLRGAAFSPTGKQLAGGAGGHELGLWSVPDGGNLGLHKTNDAIQQIAWSKSGKLIAWCTSDRQVGVWFPAGQRILFEELLHSGNVMSLAISADGRKLASLGQDNRLYVVDLTSGEKRSSGEHIPGTRHMAFAPDGQSLLLGYVDELVRLDIATWQTMRLQALGASPYAWAITRDRTHAAFFSLEQPRLEKVWWIPVQREERP